MTREWVWKTVLAAACLSACSPEATLLDIGATGAVAASEERGFSATVGDTATEMAVSTALLSHDVETFSQVSVQVYQGRVLLTGLVERPEMRVDAVRLAWQANGVREVINEIEVSDKGGLDSFAQDAWISSRLRSRLLLDKEIQSINYSIEVVDGTVYLMGLGRSAEEVARVETHARNLPYVRRVVNYARVKDQAQSQGSGP